MSYRALSHETCSVSRCFGCHLERQLGPVPVQGTPHHEVLCGRCSKQVDQAVGILEALSIELSYSGPPASTQSKEKAPPSN